jgi:hypothetical protein
MDGEACLAPRPSPVKAEKLTAMMNIRRSQPTPSRHLSAVPRVRRPEARLEPAMNAKRLWKTNQAEANLQRHLAWFLHCRLRCILMAKKGEYAFGI